MGDAGFFKGTSADQDARFENKEKKLLKNTRFPAIFSTKVDFAKVNMDVMRQWIARQVTKYLHRDDEVVVDFVFELLEAADPDPRQMQISLTGFLERNTPAFMEELWTLCDSAQNNPSRIPQQFIDEQIKLAEAARADAVASATTLPVIRRKSMNFHQHRLVQSPLVLQNQKFGVLMIDREETVLDEILAASIAKDRAIIAKGRVIIAVATLLEETRNVATVEVAAGAETEAETEIAIEAEAEALVEITTAAATTAE
ncbi:PWI domain-containing protein [Polychytrium aggregatum]|uniref:PWI domain-containing protein n=1 Tax=Polychytrium aggregatum TaxID=110093 RepID=UPI0022FEEFEC|nr:PWI domain-containing protein [Polychytrium aggregatum]KAI9197048.1 PWI domain-containing protein [Polychytrium aggregatum]